MIYLSRKIYSKYSAHTNQLRQSYFISKSHSFNVRTPRKIRFLFIEVCKNYWGIELHKKVNWRKWQTLFASARVFKNIKMLLSSKKVFKGPNSKGRWISFASKHATRVLVKSYMIPRRHTFSFAAICNTFNSRKTQKSMPMVYIRVSFHNTRYTIQ